MFRKSTLRRMRPLTRRLAKLIGEQESITRRTKNLLAEIALAETYSVALLNQGRAGLCPHCGSAPSDDTGEHEEGCPDTFTADHLAALEELQNG